MRGLIIYQDLINHIIDYVRYAGTSRLQTN